MTTATTGVSSGSDINATIGSLSGPRCVGEENGTVQIVADGGTGTISYTINGTTNTTGLFTDLDDGNFIVEVTDQADCLVTISFTLDDPDPISVMELPNYKPLEEQAPIRIQ